MWEQCEYKKLKEHELISDQGNVPAPVSLTLNSVGEHVKHDISVLAC